jgi:hypothetical protein
VRENEGKENEESEMPQDKRARTLKFKNPKKPARKPNQLKKSE